MLCGIEWSKWKCKWGQSDSRSVTLFEKWDRQFTIQSLKWDDNIILDQLMIWTLGPLLHAQIQHHGDLLLDVEHLPVLAPLDWLGFLQTWEERNELCSILEWGTGHNLQHLSLLTWILPPSCHHHHLLFLCHLHHQGEHLHNHLKRHQRSFHGKAVQSSQNG